MKTLDRQKLDVVNQTRSNPDSFRGWRGWFTPNINPIEFEGIRNEAGRNSLFLSAKSWAGRTHFKTINAHQSALLKSALLIAE